MQFFADELYMQDAAVVGIATTILTEISKRSKWKWLAFVNPAETDQIKFVAGGISLALMIFRRVQTGEINQGNWLASVQSLVAAWLMAWAMSHFMYQSVPFVKPAALPSEDKPAQQ